jgi:maltodextrin utilization protein YvdJ
MDMSLEESSVTDVVSNDWLDETTGMVSSKILEGVMMMCKLKEAVVMYYE